MGIRSSNGENTVSLGFGLQFSTYLFYDDNMRERKRKRLQAEAGGYSRKEEGMREEGVQGG